jgi:predicted ATP-dependent serine protease
LEADDGIGKKTLLVKWMEYHAKNKKGVFIQYILKRY